MLEKRIIPALLLKNGSLYKGKSFAKHRYVGDPINAVRLFNDKEVDELSIFDITKSIDKLEPDFSTLKDIVSEAFMPISYGGGISSIEIADKLFSLGIEKIYLNSNGIQDFELIENLTAKFGAQSICLSIDYKRNLFGKRKIWTHSGTKNTNIDLFEVILELKSIRIGELLITCIDAEGQRKNIDYEVIEFVSSQVNFPTLYSGGVASFYDIKNIFENYKISGLSIGNLFTFHGKLEGVLISYLNNNELDKIRNES